MKLDGMKCPHCGKTDTRAYEIENVCIWDDTNYDYMQKEFGEKRHKFSSMDNIIYRCNCDSCGKKFSAMVEMEITTKNIISRNTAAELTVLNVNECC